MLQDIGNQPYLQNCPVDIKSFESGNTGKLSLFNIRHHTAYKPKQLVSCMTCLVLNYTGCMICSYTIL
jgi:hypothetical protein